MTAPTCAAGWRRRRAAMPLAARRRGLVGAGRRRWQDRQRRRIAPAPPRATPAPDAAVALACGSGSAARAARRGAVPRQPACRATAGGRKYTTAAATQHERVSQNTGRSATPAPSRWTSTPGRSRNGALRPSPTCSRRCPSGRRQQRSTAAGSILSARQTVCASARVKVASGSASKRSASSSSSFLGVTLIDAARAAMCRPWRSRASRSSRPALGAAGPTAVPLPHSSNALRAYAAASRESGKRLRSWLPNSAAPWRLPSLFSIRAASHSVCALATSGCALTRRT